MDELALLTMADTEKPQTAVAENVPDNELKLTATIDTVHNDEAVKVLDCYEGDHDWDPAEEKKIVRKIDRRLISILCCTYGLQYYDKAMLSQAVSHGRCFRSC